MGTRLRSRLTYANVTSTIALFLALSTGVAYAANTVFSSDIVNGEVKTADIHSGAVTTSKLADGAVNSAGIHDGGVDTPDLAMNSVGEMAIKTDGVGATVVC